VLITLWTVLVSLAAPMLCGLPLAWLLLGDEPSKAWLLAPFLGIAGIIIVLENLVLLGIPLIWSAPVFWLGVGLLWVWMWRRRGGLFTAMPARVFGAALAVYAIHAIGLFLLGATFYVGRGWGDLFNYVGMAEFFARVPFHTSLAELGQQPYLFQAVTLRGDRIGQSILHAFLTLSSFSDAKTLFVPTILLMPPLTTCAVALLGESLELPAGPRTGAALLAGMLPAMALVHLEGFLSHSLSIPFLIVSLVSLSELATRPTLRRICVAALVVTAMLSIYTEIYPLLILIDIALLAYALFRRPPHPWRTAAGMIFSGLSIFVLMPLLIPSILHVLRRVDTPNVLSGLYPWAYSLDGIVLLWSGDLQGLVSGLALSALRMIAIGTCILGVYGLLRGLHIRQTVPWFGAVVFVSIPFLIRALDDAHPYQFYKILLSTSPLLPLGVVAAFLPLQAPPEPQAPRTWRRPDLASIGVWAAIIGLTLQAGVGTAYMAVRSTIPARMARVLITPMILSPDMRALQAQLGQLRDQNILITDIDDLYQNYGLMYFARHNRVWVTSPVMKKEWQGRLDLIMDTVSPKSLPTPLYIIGEHIDESLSFNLRPDDVVWSGEKLRMWRIDSPNAALVSAIHNPNGNSKAGDTTYYWLGGGETTFQVLTPTAGTLRFEVTFFPGPSVISRPDRALRISTDSGYTLEQNITEGTHSFDVPLPGGLTTIALTPLDAPEVEKLPNGDTRPVVLGMREVRIEWQASLTGAR
jgi:hypothetical protein